MGGQKQETRQKGAIQDRGPPRGRKENVSLKGPEGSRRGSPASASGVTRLRQALDEEPAVAFGDDAGIEHGHHPPVRPAADQPADALPKLGLRRPGRVSSLKGLPPASRIRSAWASVMGCVGGSKGSRVITTQVGERVAVRDVHPGPEAVGAKEDGIAQRAHLPGELGAAGALALEEEGPPGGLTNPVSSFAATARMSP